MDEDEKPGKNKLDVGAEAIFNLAAKTPAGALKSFALEEEEVVEEEEDEEEAPILINRDLESFQAVLEEADVILEVVDARDPLETRSKFIEQYANEGKKKLLVVLNKIGMSF